MKLLSLALGDARGGATDMDRGNSSEDSEVPIMDSKASLSLSLGPCLGPSLGLSPGPSMKFQRVCVFCGSSSGNKIAFSHAAYDLGNCLVQRRMNLVYGGGSVGLMGLISKTVFNGGCHVVGVIPKALVSHEISGQAIGEVKVVADMHERKAEMARQADAFIALPGGYGTLEELLEIIAWSQLGIHNKPVGLLNVDGYYNALLALFDKGVEEGFIKPSSRHIVVSATNADDLLCRMEEYVPMHDCVAPRQNWEVEELNDFSFGTQQ